MKFPSFWYQISLYLCMDKGLLCHDVFQLHKTAWPGIPFLENRFVRKLLTRGPTPQQGPLVSNSLARTAAIMHSQRSCVIALYSQWPVHRIWCRLFFIMAKCEDGLQKGFMPFFIDHHSFKGQHILTKCSSCNRIIFWFHTVQSLMAIWTAVFGLN